MRRVFLVLFCLSFVSSMAWASPSEVSPTSNFSIEELGFSFQTIKAGSFTMGSPEDEEFRDENETQVEVTISEDFEMQMTEVTQMQYFLVTGETPSYFRSPKYCENYDKVNEICPDHPVEQVSWYEAKEFIRKLNASEGVEGCEGTPEDPRGCYRLPTEAEFERAVRGETKTAYFFGNNASQLGKYAVYRNNSGGRTHKVTTGLENPNKLKGIVGNVWEWVEDSYKDELEGGKDPLNRKSECQGYLIKECRVLRGGGWYGSAKYLRSAFRNEVNPNSRYDDVGFRLVRMQKALMLATATSEEQPYWVSPREDAVPSLSLLPLYPFFISLVF